MPLMIGHEAAVQLFLSRGADVNLTTVVSSFVAHYLILLSHWKMPLVFCASQGGVMILISAFSCGILSIVELLLRTGADHSHQDNVRSVDLLNFHVFFVPLSKTADI